MRAGPATEATPRVERLDRDINGERRAVLRVRSAGRVIEAVRLDMAEQWDLMEIAGSAIDNQAWVNTALLAASVISVDGVPEPSGAKTREHIRRVLKKIGEDGVDALCAAFDEDESGPADAEASEQAAGN